MDQNAAHELAMAVAIGITEAMASQTWQGLRPKIAQALARGDEARSRRRGEALDKQRPLVLSARRNGDGAAEASVRDHWASRVQELLEDHPGQEIALRRLLTQLPTPTESGDRRVYQQAVTKYGSNYQAGRDQTIDNSRKTRKSGGAGPLLAVIVLLILFGAVGGGVAYYRSHHSDGGNENSGTSATAGASGSAGGGNATAGATQGGSSGQDEAHGVPAAALSASANGLTGASTCGDWLAADQDTQYSLVQRVSVAENSPMASNPFPIQEMKYDCQNNMRFSVARIIWDLETPHASTTT
jgi:hypothetical protein